MKLISKEPMPPTNPYIAGVFLGLTLLASFLILGAGLGASGGLARISAFLEGLLFPAHTLATEYFGAWGKNPLNYYLVFMLIGVFIGGLVSAICPAGSRWGLSAAKQAPCIFAFFSQPPAAFFPALPADLPADAHPARPFPAAPCCFPAASSS